MCTCYLDEGSGRTNTCALVTWMRDQVGVYFVAKEGACHLKVWPSMFPSSLFPFMGNALIVLEVTYMFVLGVRLSLVEGFFSPSN